MKWLGGGDGNTVVTADMDRGPQRTQDDAAVGYEFQRAPDPEFPAYGQKQPRWALGDDSIVDNHDKWKYTVNNKMATPPYLGQNPTMPGLYDISQNKNIAPEHVMYLSGHLSGQMPSGLPMHPSYMQQSVQQQNLQIPFRQGQQIISTINTPTQNVMLDVDGDISPHTEAWFINQCKELLPISPATMSILDTAEEKPGEELLQHSGSLSKDQCVALHVEDTTPGIDTSHCVSVDGIKPILRTNKQLVKRKNPFYFRPNGTRRQFLVWLPSGERLRMYKDEAVKLGYIDAPRTNEDD